MLATGSDETVATVNEDGLVEAVGAGHAEITATAGGKSDACIVTVNEEEPETTPTPDAAAAPDVSPTPAAA